VKKINLQITYDEEKMEAVRLFLAQRNSSIELELTAFADVLYRKNVPANVREFIDLKGGSEKKLKGKEPSGMRQGDGA
jgi:hypothetical protein